MKLAIENFFLPIKCGLVGIFLTLPLSAEPEVWFDANGKPILVKDTASGRLRVLSAEEIAAIEKPQVEAKEAPVAVEQETNLEDKQIAEIAPPVAEKSSQIPFILTPKVYTENKYYLRRNYSYSPYYSSYPYFSGAVIPRFSNNGYYGPAQYYRPSYRHYNRNYSNCGKGIQLRYSRPRFSIRAKF